MTERLKTSTIYKANSKVIGIDSEAHAEYIADFEANHKASTEIVTDYLIAETTAISNVEYPVFESAVTLWSAVDCKETNSSYELYLLES